MNRMPGKAGLGLLELLIALALLALIASGLATSMGLGIRLYERTMPDADSTDEIALRIRLRALLSAAEPPAPGLPFAAGLAGNPSGFTFTTLASPQLFPDSAALRISVISNGDGLSLSLETLDDDGAAIDTLSRVLAAGVSGLSFTYFDDAREPARWLSEWTDTTRLPALVRITADPGSTPDWPEFTVRPRLGG